MSCETCRKWQHDDRWQVQKRGGKPIPRSPNAILPCHRGQCPKGKPENEANVTLSAKNWRAVAYWHQAKACGGQLPLDDLSRENLGLVESVMRANETVEQTKANMAAIAPMLAMIGGTDGRRR